MNLNDLGWNQRLEEAFYSFGQQGYQAGRVVTEHKNLYREHTHNGELVAAITGKMRFQAIGRADLPAVGDWVVIKMRDGENKASIHHILERKSKFSRKSAGNAVYEQIVAANVDTVFLVMALNHDFNLRRMERYLILAWETASSLPRPKTLPIYDTVPHVVSEMLDKSAQLKKRASVDVERSF